MTSAPAGSAQPAYFLRNPDSLLSRVAGMIHAPRLTLMAVADTARSADVLALSFVVGALFSGALLATDTGQLALLDQWERTAIAFGQVLDDQQYAALERASRNGVLYAVVSALVSGPLMALALSALLYWVFSGTIGRLATYWQVLAIVAHSGVVLVLRQVVSAPINYSRETLASPTTAATFLAGLDEASPVARFFGVVDLFIVWWIVLVAIGMSALYQQKARRLAGVFIGVYVALAALLAVVMAIADGP